jgi:hypothetical protein
VLWQKLLESCVSETNPDKLEKLVFDAEDAIYLRMRELTAQPYRSDESLALKQAAQQLLQLKIEKMGWRDPAKAKAHAN